MKKHLIANLQQAYYKVVISENATPTEEFAAAELSDFIRQSVGVALPIIRDCDAPLSTEGCFISVGMTHILEFCQLGFDYGSLNEEGFFIKSVGNLIVMDGANERAKLYSVYHFLETFLGIRFLTPETTHVPKMAELSVDDLDIVEVPAFARRDIFALGAYADLKFSARLRVSSALHPNHVDMYGGSYCEDYLNGDCHSFHILLPPAKYKAAHPDWYEGSNGKQVCLSNSEVYEEMLKVILAELAARPKIRWVIVGLMDSASLCTCPKCTESHERTTAQSGTLMIFVNKIARGVQAWIDENQPGREVLVETLCYDWTFPPPVDVLEDGSFVPSCPEVVPESNVVVKMAGIDIDYFHKLDDASNKYNKRFYGYMRGWAALTKKLAVYDYTCCFSGYLYWYSTMGLIHEYYQRYLELGVTSQLTQHNGLGRTDFQSIVKTYLISKLMWNPYQDPWTIIKEFCQLYYGEDVAPYVLRTIRRFEDFYTAMNFYGKSNNLADPEYLKPVNIPRCLLTDCIEILEEGEKIVNGSDRTEEEKAELIKRIRCFKLTPEYMLFVGRDTYYPDDTEQHEAIADNFFADAELCGVEHHIESRENTIATLKEEFYKGDNS